MNRSLWAGERGRYRNKREKKTVRVLCPGRIWLIGAGIQRQRVMSKGDEARNLGWSQFIKGQ